MVKKPLLIFLLLFVIGLVGGAGLRPLILQVMAGDIIASQAVQAAAPAIESLVPSAAVVESENISIPSEPVEEASNSEPPTGSTVQIGADRVALVIDQAKLDPDNPETYNGLPAGLTADGYPYLGDPDAPITLEEYSDFLCPFCARHFNQTMSPLLENYIRAGQVKYVFHDMPLVGLHPTAPRGHIAADCLAHQSPALFWLMHDELFKRQAEWQHLPNPDDYLASMAVAIGADMTAYEACVTSEEQGVLIESRVAAGRELGFNGTPSFQFIQHQKDDQTYTLVGAHPLETFAGWLDALIAGEAPPQEAEPEPGELPFWANREGLTPDPDRPGFTMAGDAYKGNPDAELVVVEFADFQCPSCQRHALETQPAVDERFVETGEIMWVFKPLPLKEHAHAPVAAVAAECAGDQGQFWGMHHLLFETLDEWSTADMPDAALLGLAGRLDLDANIFQTCSNSRQPLEAVLRDMYDAQGIVETTPTFIFLFGGRGNLSKGALPPDQFIRRVEGMLEQTKRSE